MSKILCGAALAPVSEDAPVPAAISLVKDNGSVEILR